MRNEFLTDTVNVSRFLTGVSRVENSGADEACWQLCEGDPGHGKSRTLVWWGAQKNHVTIRARASWTPNSAMKELVQVLGHQPAERYDPNFRLALEILARTGRGLIIDEAQHCLKRDAEVLEGFRDISDLAGSKIIVAGHRGISAKLKRHAQIFSRIADVTPFGPCPIEDVRLFCDRLAESAKGAPLHIGDDLVKEIHIRTEGRLRSVKMALANIERAARQKGLKAVELKDIPVSILTSDGQIGRSR